MYRMDYRAARNDLALCSTLPRGYEHVQSKRDVEKWGTWYTERASREHKEAEKQDIEGIDTGCVLE